MVDIRISVVPFALLMMVPLVASLAESSSKTIRRAASRAEHSSVNILSSGSFQRTKASLRRSYIDDLKQDSLFNLSWVRGTQHRPVQVETSENCSRFEGHGYICEIETAEHELLKKWIPKNATVMEFGARFGTTTCEIAKKLVNSGRLVAIEPDFSVWNSLERNVKSNNCHARVLRGAVSGSPASMYDDPIVKGNGYAGRVNNRMQVDGSVPVPAFRFDDVESASGLKFDTLLIDCEGCVQDIMDQIAPKIQSQIKLIIIEADMPDTGGDCTSHCVNYTKVFDYLDKSGFEQADKFNDCDRARTKASEGNWCGAWINHYAFKKVRPSTGPIWVDDAPPWSLPTSDESSYSSALNWALGYVGP